MPRPLSPQIRQKLVERAARMLARRETVTARSLAEAAGTSTTALYTYFGGMDGLWRAVRQEGFERMKRAVACVEESADPVFDLAALGVAYVGSAVAHPDLYRAMFEADFDLEDPTAATATFQVLVTTAARATAAGRFRADTDPLALATRVWAIGHGLASLVCSGALDEKAIAAHAPETTLALFVAAGDDVTRCRESVLRAWQPAASPVRGA